MELDASLMGLHLPSLKLSYFKRIHPFFGFVLDLRHNER